MTLSRRLALVACGLAIAGGGLVWLWGRGGGLVDETVALQQRLLSGTVTGRDLKSGVRQVVRNVDKMDRAAVRRVQAALARECQSLQQAAIDDYFAADEDGRVAVLDRDIGRLVAAGELWFAANPQSSGQPPRQRTPKKDADKPKTTEPSQELKLFESYRTAIQARAAKRGVTLPVWLLRPPRG